MTLSDNRIRDVLLELAHKRGSDKTFCPSEVARAAAEDWRALMPEVRRVADELDSIEAVQNGQTVRAQAARGPIRLRLAQPR